MKKATIRPTATPQSSFRLSRPDRAIEENRFTLPVSRPVILVKSESWGRNSNTVTKASDSATNTHRWGLQSRWWGAELTATLANRRPLPCHPGTGSGPPHPYQCPEPAGQDTEGTGSAQDKHSDQHLTPNKTSRDQEIQMPPGPHTDKCAMMGQGERNYLKPIQVFTALRSPLQGARWRQKERTTTDRFEPGDLGGQAVSHPLVFSV